MLGWLFNSSSTAKAPETKQEEPATCPVAHQPSPDGCPVDHSAFANLPPGHASIPSSLSHERQTSSIPRYSQDASKPEGNWVYPSPAQFYTSLQRKNRSPSSVDMDVVVPIHNAVNEQCWQEILKWESTTANVSKDDVKLVSFKGRPQDTSPKAWFKTLIGYQRPFDRHDWLIDRAGTRVRYVIDFYAGRLPLSFYLDVRPAVDSLDAVQMRASRFMSSLFSSPSTTQADKAT